MDEVRSLQKVAVVKHLGCMLLVINGSWPPWLCPGLIIAPLQKCYSVADCKDRNWTAWKHFFFPGFSLGRLVLYFYYTCHLGATGVVINMRYDMKHDVGL